MTPAVFWYALALAGTGLCLGAEPPIRLWPGAAPGEKGGLGEEQDTIEDVYEPYLLQRGLLERTPRGRAATRRAYGHLGLEPPGPQSLL